MFVISLERKRAIFPYNQITEGILNSTYKLSAKHFYYLEETIRNQIKGTRKDEGAKGDKLASC